MRGTYHREWNDTKLAVQRTGLWWVVLLTTISFPAFATMIPALYSQTKERVVEQLKGQYGFKRFLGDGYATELEDNQRRYYHKGETMEFDNVEIEWPVFFLNMIIDGVFKDLPEQVLIPVDLTGGFLIYRYL